MGISKAARALTPVRKNKTIDSGTANYDNPRENIDPHIKTKVISGNNCNFTSKTSPIGNFIKETDAATAQGVLALRARTTAAFADGFGATIGFTIQRGTVSNIVGSIRCVRNNFDDEGEFVFTIIATGGAVVNMLKINTDGIEVFGNVIIKNNNELRLRDNGNYVGFEAPALTANQIWVLPDADGTAGQGLKTDASGNLGWSSFSLTSHTHRLDEIQNPNTNKVFTMSNKVLSFRYTAPTPSGDDAGAFNIEASGGFTGDLLHVHQHTGNPGVTDLCHFEADDPDVCILRLNHTDDSGVTLLIEKGDVQGILYSHVKRSDVYTFNPIAGNSTQLLGLRTWQDETISVFVAQPDIPRTIRVEISPLIGTATGTVTINGTDADGATIQEILTVNTSIRLTYETSKAFGLVSSIVTDQTGISNSNYSVGIGTLFGLQNYPFNASTDVFKASIGGVNATITTVDIINGTVDFGVGFIAGTLTTVWYRPFK